RRLRIGIASPRTSQTGRDPRPPGQMALTNARRLAVRNPLDLLERANTTPHHRHEHVRAVVWPAEVPPSTRHANEERQSAADGRGLLEIYLVTAHKCLQPHQRGRRLERGVQLHRLPSVRVRDWHKCGFHSRAVLSAACRDNAWPPANEWWRWINRPNNF